jgi:hypothetical protein
VLDEHSGMRLAKMAGEVWDQAAIPAEAKARERGNRILTLEEAEAARWREATRPVVDAWLRQTQDKGLDGQKLLAEAKALLAQYEQA